MQMTLTGLELANMSARELDRRVKEFANKSGVAHVASGEVVTENHPAKDETTFRAVFDSSFWTGRNFPGFGRHA